MSAPRPRLACGRRKAKRTQRHRPCPSARSPAHSEKQQTESMQSIPVPRALRHSRSLSMIASTHADAASRSCGARGLRRARPQQQGVTPARQAVLGQRQAEAAGANARPGAGDAAPHAGPNHRAISSPDFFIGGGLKSGVVLPPTPATATDVSGCVPGGFCAFAGVKVTSLKRANLAKAGDAKSTV